MPPVPRPPGKKQLPRKNLLIAGGAAVIVAVALIVGSLLLTGGGSDSSATTGATGTTGGTDTAITLLAGIPQDGTMLGKDGATVKMLQFEDLQCPICREYTKDAFSSIVDEYVRPGRVKIDFRGLAFLGPDSEKALRIAYAAGLQNKLWQVVELFYEDQGEENSGWVTDAAIDKVLSAVPGLDIAKVKADAGGAAVTNLIKDAQTEAATLKVPGTPWFYLAVGLNQPYEVKPQSLTPSAFRPILDDALKG